MHLHRSSFIGYSERERYQRFSGALDSSENFAKNLVELGPDWEYATTDVTYIRNSNGHRSPEIKDINLDNYILFAGCSLTEGVGVPVELRYSNVLANLLNCDLYNMGLGGTGNDILFYNLMTWFSKVKQKPKLVVISWTSESRFATLDNEIVNINGIWSDNSKDFIAMGDENNYFNTKTWMIKQITRRMIEVPIIELPWHTAEFGPQLEPSIIAPIYSEHTIDLSRDLVHPGIKSNKLYAELIFDQIKKYNFCTT